MGDINKPGVDWSAIREEWETEHTSFRQLAAKHDLAAQSISKRARKEQWANGENNLVAMPNWPKLVKKTRVAQMSDSHSNNGKVGDRVKIAVTMLEYIAEGTPERYAAEAAGVREQLWHDWKHHNVDLAELVRQAKGLRARQRIKNIEKSSDGGDWRASAYLLERDLHTKEDFKKPDDGAGAIQIIFNMPRGDLDDTKIIEGTPADEADHPKLHADR